MTVHEYSVSAPANLLRSLPAPLHPAVPGVRFYES